MAQKSNNQESSSTHCGSNYWPILTQKVPNEAQMLGLQILLRLFVKNTSLNVNRRQSKIRSLHMYWVLWIHWCVVYCNVECELLWRAVHSVRKGWKIFFFFCILSKYWALELRQYKNNSMELTTMLVLKLSRFFSCQYGEEESATISKLFPVSYPDSKFQDFFHFFISTCNKYGSFFCRVMFFLSKLQ